MLTPELWSWIRLVAGQAASNEQVRGKLQMIKDAYDRVESD